MMTLETRKPHGFNVRLANLNHTVNMNEAVTALADAPPRVNRIGYPQRLKTRLDRLFDKIESLDEEKGCWLLAGRGYGRFWDGARMVKTHRFAFEVFIRKLEQGECACHDV